MKELKTILEPEFINQSLIKKFYHNGNEKEHCPQKELNAEFIETEPMTNGKYFETLLLGGSAKGDSVTDLRRKKLSKDQIRQNIINKNEGRPLILGEKRIDQIRIEQQVEIAKMVAAKHQMSIFPGINTQIKVSKRWEKDDDIILRGEFDLFPTGIYSKKYNKYLMSLVDLKLTGDIDSTFGAYCYGVPKDLDPLQGLFYQYLVYDLDYELNPHLVDLFPKHLADKAREELHFYLWIFDYKKQQLGNRFIPVVYDKLQEAYLFESIRRTLSLIEKYNDIGWNTNPSSDLCSKCSLKDTCSDYFFNI